MKPNILACLALSLLIMLAVCAAASPASASPMMAAAATLTPTARPMATPLTTVEVRQDCITIEDSLPADLRPGGALLLDGTYRIQGRYGVDDSIRKNSMYHLDLMSQRNSPLPYSAQDLSVSPDGKWLAYLDIVRNEKGYQKDRILQVTNAQGLHLDMAYWGLNWQYLIGWLDNTHLLLEAPSYPTGNYIVLNPFTTHKEVIRLDIPDLPDNRWWDNFHDALPDPTLRYWAADTGTNHSYWRLMSRDNWQVLWKSVTSSDPPQWSPDGRYFTIMDMRGYLSSWMLLRVGTDGQVVTLADHLGPGSELSWSPDSHFLAGWVQIDPKSDESPNHLVLINAEEPLLTDLCFENQKESGPYSYIYNAPPVWSPDGRFLAIKVSRIETIQYYKDYYTDETFWDTALIDLQEHRAYRLVKDAVPVAWMRKQK